jgi:hypothetical protein
LVAGYLPRLVPVLKASSGAARCEFILLIGLLGDRAQIAVEVLRPMLEEGKSDEHVGL